MERELLIGLGDHPALDFLNSTAVPSRETVELIPHGAGYLRWLLLAGLISDQEHSALQAQFSQAELDGAALAAVRLRERLRPMIEAWAAGDPGVPDEALLSALNEILAESSHRPRLTRSAPTSISRTGGPGTPRGALLAPVAEAVADLLVRGDRSLVATALIRMHVVVLRPHQGPSPTLVLDGPVRQQRQSPRLSGAGHERRFVAPDHRRANGFQRSTGVMRVLRRCS